MDQTTHFRAVIKAVRAQRRHLQSDNLPCNNHGILPKSKSSSKSAFSKRAKDVTSSITQLRDFILAHRKDYVNISGHLSGTSAAMSDVVREQIDKEAAQLIQACQQRIRALHSDAASVASSVSKQVTEHQQYVIHAISTYLQGVCQLYKDQQTVRVRQLVEKQRLSRLETESAGLSTSSLSTSSQSKTDASSSFRSRLSQFSLSWTGRGSPDSAGTTATAGGSSADNAEQQAPTTATTEDYTDEEVDDALSESERMEFEQENLHLPHEMDLLQDEVKKIQGAVMEISKLQEDLSNKIMDQADQIDRVADDVVLSTENVSGGNENIREAIKNNASWRVWIIFFLLMCSICLLFLDWYSS